MSLRRWNSVVIPGSSADIAHQDAETSNLTALRQLTRSSPSVNKKQKMELDTSEEGSAPSEDDQALQLIPTKNKARQKKFLVHFDKKEPVLEYYSCAFAAEILLQGYLYITKNHLGFYSNVFGRITKILIEVKEVEKVTKANTAIIFPNAIQIHTKSERYTFGSFIFREAAFFVLNQVIGHQRESVRRRRQTQKVRISSPPTGEFDVDSESPNDQADDTDQTPPTPTTTRVSLTARRKSNVTISSTFAAVHEQRKPPSKKLIYAIALLVLLFSISAVNLYFRISRLMDERSSIEAPVPDDQIIKSFKDWELTHDAGVDGVLSTIDQNLKRIRHASAALEKLKSDYDALGN